MDINTDYSSSTYNSQVVVHSIRTHDGTKKCGYIQQYPPMIGQHIILVLKPF